MASANRHWPSMFKSKPCNPNHQFPHDSLISTPTPGSNKTPYTSGGGCEEKGPEPKPRWNPKAEQIRILEGIFNSGMVNPPREEIRKIRIQLQEYGQVGDANVFYWFQNRKSRTKHKLRNLTKHHHNTAASNNNHNLPANSSSSSNSSDHKLSSPPKDLVMNISSANPNVINHNNKGFSSNVISTEVAGPNSPTASVNQTFFQPLNNNHLIPPPTTTPQPSADHESFFPTALYHNNHDGAAITTEAAGGQLGSYDDFVSELFQQQPNYPTNTAYAQQPCANMLLNEIMMTHHELASKNTKYLHDQDHQNQSQFISFSQPATTNNFVPSTTTTTPVTVPSPITAHHQFQGVGDANAATARSTVFINDVAFEVGVGPFNVREAFGDDALLIQSSGHPVLTDHWGLTLYPLQHGASYYLV